jgi:hypothetical protein
VDISSCHPTRRSDFVFSIFSGAFIIRSMGLGNTFEELNFVTEYQNEAFPNFPLDPGIYGPVAYGTFYGYHHI